MNKKMVSAALAATFVLSTGAALASTIPVDFSGDFRLQHRSFNNDISDLSDAGGTSQESFLQYRLRLNATGKLDENLSFFLRYSDRNKVESHNHMPGELDWYGLKGKLGNWNYSVGRQSITLGQGSVMSTGDDAAVATELFEGVILSTTAGKVNVQVIGGQTSGDDKEWYGFDASTKITDKVNAGVAFAKDASSDMNYWAVNTTVKVAPQFDLAAEYIKSDADTLDTGYFVAGTYTWDKNSFTVQYNDVEANAADAYISGIGGVSYPMAVGFTPGNSDGYSGFTYYFARPVAKDTTFTVLYLDLEADNKEGSAKEFATALIRKF